MELTLDHIRDVKIYQSKNGYRFSVDPLLLSHFVNMPVVEKIADLGAGSGVIGLLLARKYPHASVTLFELQEGLAAAAERNVVLNRLEKRATVINADLRDTGNLSLRAGTGCFDIAVSNPPFRKERSGLVSSGEEKAIARHEIRLKLPELVSAARFLLRAKGRFFLIYHPGRLAELTDVLKQGGMEVKRLRFIHSHAASEAKMVLVEAVYGGRVGLKVERPLCLYDEKGEYTEEMRSLYATQG
ncbi:MAG: tRNA1(Val) (adenine(37)-N6)-methyltransferase [Nitrospirae bacterium]|nr:tRNA1(Val) (adenine(37)-N6)-methyltransferase [Nitrospirota bacterium]